MRRDLDLDEFLTLCEPASATLLGWLVPLVEATEDRQRRRTTQAADAFRCTLVMITANALEASLTRRRGVRYRRKLATYSGRCIYYPPWLASKTVNRTIDALAQSGMLRTASGERGAKGRPGRESTFTATDAFLDALGGLGVTKNALTRSDAAPVFVLKGLRKQPVNYDPTNPVVAGGIERLRTYNRFLGTQTLDLAMGEEELRALNDRYAGDGRHNWPPMMSRNRLHRIFNDSSWERNGRHYGGWWQTIPSEARRFLTINGEPTVELDFSGFMPRAVYHCEGRDYENDPYEIPAIRDAAERQGAEWGSIRDSIKTMLVALINADPFDRLDGMTGLTLPRGITRRAAFHHIADHHRQVEGWFRQGRGLELMNKESVICEKIINYGVKKRNYMFTSL